MKYIPILGRLRYASSMKYQVDNIITRLYLVQENQFQIIDINRVPSLKRAFKNCSVYEPMQLEELAYNEIKMALSYTFNNFEIYTKVVKIKDMTYRLEISGYVYNHDNSEKCELNVLLSYNGSSFTRMLEEQNND